MNKSEAYHLAQVAVVNSPSIAPENKLAILKILLEDENIAQFMEEHKPETAE